MHGLWAEDAQKRNIFPPIHTPPPGSPHIWLRLPRCLLGRDIFWQVARASDGGHWFYPRKESGPSFLLSTTMGMASRICPPRFSTCARTTLHSPPSLSQSTRLYLALSLGPSIGRELVPFACPSLPIALHFRPSPWTRPFWILYTPRWIETGWDNWTTNKKKNFKIFGIPDISWYGKILKLLPIDESTIARTNSKLSIVNCSIGFHEFSRISKFDVMCYRGDSMPSNRTDSALCAVIDS